MSAATADRDARRAEGKLKAYLVAASTIIYKDTLVGTNSAGHLVAMSDAASLTFEGVAVEKVDNSAGSAGDLKCRVWAEGEFTFVYAGGDATQAVVGDPMYAQDSQTVDEDVALTTNDYPVGHCTEVISATSVRVLVSKHIRAAGLVAAGDIGTGAVTAIKLSTTLKTGYIHLPLTGMRVVATNDLPVSGTPDGGVLSKDTAPLLERVNGATDKALRVKWAASSSVEIILGEIAYPPDLDDAAAIVVNLLLKMGGATDTPTAAVGYFEGVGDTNAGGATTSLSGTLTHKTVSIAAGDVGAYPKPASITLTPGAHTTDTCELYAAWITYTRA